MLLLQEVVLYYERPCYIYINRSTHISFVIVVIVSLRGHFGARASIKNKCLFCL